MSDPENPDIYFCDPPAAVQQGAVELRDLTRERSGDYDLPNSPRASNAPESATEQPSLPPEQRPAAQRPAEARVSNKRTYCDA